MVCYVSEACPELSYIIALLCVSMQGAPELSYITAMLCVCMAWPACCGASELSYTTALLDTRSWPLCKASWHLAIVQG